MTKPNHYKRITRSAALLTAAGIISFSAASALACGWGNSGGSDYTPQRQGGYAANQAAAAIGADQAGSIVQSHVAKLNPDLNVGGINDAGGFFEVEVLNKGSEVVQVLGVDKYSGRLMLLN